MKRAFSLILLLVFSLEGFSKSRIIGPKDPKARCVNPISSSETCEFIRKKSLEENCITQEEYEILKRNGSYPACNMWVEKDADKLLSWCPCGCFAPDTLINVFSEMGFLERKEMASDLVFGKQDYLVTHLSDESSLDSFSYEASPIRLKTHGKEFKKVYVVKPYGKSSITLTERHPVLLSTGVMKQIKDVTLKDMLVLSSGEPVKIEKIERIPFKQEVVNFSLETEKNKEHLIFANDIVVGDQYWQASLENLMNKVLLRI